MKRIYIAGPMSGLPDSNYPAFNEAAAELRALGYHVENPAENDLPKNSKWEVYMRKAMAQLITCDLVVLLPGWGASHGANVEREFAVGVGIKVVAIEALLPHRAEGRATHVDGKFSLHQGSNIDVLRTMADNSVDSIVCDPPYELGFMGKGWDSSGIAYNIELWQEAMRVLKPGGHLLAFSGSRTYHRMTVAIEEAGFDVRDQVLWIYGSGFPKSLDVSKAINKAAGHWRGRAGAVIEKTVGQVAKGTEYERADKGDPVTSDAAEWQGWGTALKPAHEPVCVARKPLTGTVAQNVLVHGTGGLNIGACRIGDDGGTRKERSDEKSVTDSVGGYLNAEAGELVDGLGRWPANVIHDGSREVWSRFPIDGNASAIRFFYGAKASQQDRHEGLPEGRNFHPTVKPTDLMRYLCRLVTPPGGIVMDIFMGSGSTGKAAILEGFRFIGIDLMADHVEIARARIEFAEVMRGDAPRPANDNDSHPDLFAAAGL